MGNEFNVFETFHNLPSPPKFAHQKGFDPRLPRRRFGSADSARQTVGYWLPNHGKLSFYLARPAPADEDLAHSHDLEGL